MNPSLACMWSVQSSDEERAQAENENREAKDKQFVES